MLAAMPQRARVAGRARLGLALALIAAAGAADCLYVVPLVTHPGLLGQPAWLTGFARWAGDGAVLLLIALLLYVGGLGCRRLERAGVWVVWTVALTGFWAQALKHLIGRPRPRVFATDAAWLPVGPTFAKSIDALPSGHAMGAFAVATLLAAVLPRGAAVWYALASLIALGRVVGGSHWATDVLAGGYLGCLIGAYTAERWRAELADAVA